MPSTREKKAKEIGEVRVSLEESEPQREGDTRRERERERERLRETERERLFEFFDRRVHLRSQCEDYIDSNRQELYYPDVSNIQLHHQ